MMIRHKHSLLLVGTLLLSSCSSTGSSDEKNREERYYECKELAKKASSLQQDAIASGEYNYESPEWKLYDQARDRFMILNCREWDSLSYL
jgi:outer membrane biogenesis lipoprotein LolB